MTQLSVTGVDAFYGESHILFDVSFEISAGELAVIIGRNGAGKTTTLKTIMGVVEPRSGSIEFNGEDVTGLSPNEISKRGIALVPEDRRIFSNLTVEENIRMGGLGHQTAVDVDEKMPEVLDYFPRLKERRDQQAGQMSGGEQQMLTISRALMSDPDLLMLDEPTEGLMPSIVEKLCTIIQQLNEDGISILLVEQNADLAFEISDYGYILEDGSIQVEGPSDELRENDEIKRKFLALG